MVPSLMTEYLPSPSTTAAAVPALRKSPRSSTPFVMMVFPALRVYKHCQEWYRWQLIQ